MSRIILFPLRSKNDEPLNDKHKITFLQNAMDVGEPETGPSSPGGLSVGKDSSRASNEFDSGIETMEVDDGSDKLKATEKRKRTSSRYIFVLW